MNNSKKIIFFSFISLLFFVGQFALKNSFASAENGNKTLFFNKDMRIGDKNEDVRALQKILNKNPATKVSSSGAGSLGNESDFFGQLTKNAVIKFQELHKSDILRPFDLKFGTGFVGIATRLKLNSLLEADTGSSSISMIVNSSSLSKYSSKSSQSSASSKIKKMSAVMPAVSSSETFSSSSSENSTVVRVYSPSEYQISPAKNLILEGEGFTSTSNTIHLGENNSIPNLDANEDGTKIFFTVPKYLPLGKYGIWVTNANGTSKSETIKIYIVVTDNPVERPVIEKVEPAEATIDSEITVSGKGFTASGNNIYAGFGDVMNISSSDGKTIKFKASSMAQLAKLQNDKNAKNILMEVSFYISNDNGYNEDPASFTIKL